jgi:hypothetical protein
LLRVGNNTGKIVIASGVAANAPLELMVNVQVIGYSVNQPLMRRD